MKSLFVLMAVFVPFVAAAQNLGEIETFFGSISGFINNTLIPLVFGLALLVFLWGVFKFFILGGAEESKREEGKKLMLWSVIGFVLMVSIFGIVNLVSTALPDDEALKKMPDVPVGNQ